jgi:uncharacterized protein YjbJ (UPF0337 family)
MGDHTTEDMKGRIKTAVGDITGDKALQREGKAEQMSAAIKDKIDEVADKMKEAVTPKR